MNNTVKKLVSVLLVVITIVSIGLISVNATQNVPYGSKTASISLFKTSATAKITKCNCSPVDNHLEVWIRAQYKVGDNYYYYIPSGEGSYYFNKGDNVSEISKTITHDNICYTDGFYYARCGNGDLEEYVFAINKR